MKRPRKSKRVGDIHWIIFSVDYTFINYGPKWAHRGYIIYEASLGDVVEYESINYYTIIREKIFQNRVLTLKVGTVKIDGTLNKSLYILIII